MRFFQFQKAGHYLDSLAAGVDSMLEEEELFADQLKEYLFFAAALQAVCRRQEILQLQLERAEELVVIKSLEKEKVQQGMLALQMNALYKWKLYTHFSVGVQ